MANSGTGDLSVYTWKPEATPSKRGFSSERRIPAGGQPVDLAEFQLDGETQLLVANGAGSVAFLAPEQGFRRLREVAIGGHPSGLAVVDVARDLDLPGLVAVADASGPRVQLLGRSGQPAGVLQIPGPAATANALVATDLDGDGLDDIVVADRASKTVVAFDGRGAGRFAQPRTVRSGVDASTLVAGDFGGDYQHLDVAISDAARNELSLMLTPGDPLIVTGVDPVSLSADAGVLAWSYKAADGKFQLATRQGTGTAVIPIAASDERIVARVGRLAPGRPAIAYVACRKGACAPKAWDIHAARERKLPIRAPSGCRLRGIAVWDSTIAYDVRRASRRCAAGAAGVWLRARSARPTRRASGELGDLREGFLTWLAPWAAGSGPGGLGKQIRVARLGGRARTIDRVGIDALRWFELPTISDHAVVYGLNNGDEEPGGIDVIRLRLTRGACTEAFTDEPRMAVPDIDNQVTFAMDRNRIYYNDLPRIDRPSGEQGIFQIDPARVRWHRDCSIARW